MSGFIIKNKYLTIEVRKQPLPFCALFRRNLVGRVISEYYKRGPYNPLAICPNR